MSFGRARRVPGVLVTALIIGCATSAPTTDARPALFDVVDLQGASGVIVPPAYGPTEWVPDLFYGMHIDGFWLVTPEDVQRAHARIRIELEVVRSVMDRELARASDGNARLRDLDFILGHFGEFDSQYIGFVLKGRRRVMCNFFADEGARTEDLWRREWITVDGGGPAYWTIVYDVGEDRCHDFSPNSSM